MAGRPRRGAESTQAAQLQLKHWPDYAAPKTAVLDAAPLMPPWLLDMSPAMSATSRVGAAAQGGPARTLPDPIMGASSEVLAHKRQRGRMGAQMAPGGRLAHSRRRRSPVPSARGPLALALLLSVAARLLASIRAMRCTASDAAGPPGAAAGRVEAEACLASSLCLMASIRVASEDRSICIKDCDGCAAMDEHVSAYCVGCLPANTFLRMWACCEPGMATPVHCSRSRRRPREAQAPHLLQMTILPLSSKS